MGWDFPLSFGSEDAALKIYNMNYNILNDTLDNSTYANFGTVPRDSTSLVKLYVENSGLATIYSAKLVGIESSGQYGDAEDTYEAMNLPIELGNLEGKEIAKVDVEWEIPSDISLGLKIWGIQAQDSDEFEFINNHDYWKKITITNNDTDLLTDFQVEINFDAASITWANTTSDGRDIRFYDENFNLLPYWIHTWTPTTTTGKVYVRIPKLESGNDYIIYMGYGNSDLASLSNGVGTFELFEDFEGSFLNNWTLTGAMTYTFTSTALRLLGGGAEGTGLIIALPWLTNFVVEVGGGRTSVTTNHNNCVWIAINPTDTGTSSNAAKTQVIRDYGLAGGSVNQLYVVNYYVNAVAGAFTAKSVFQNNGVAVPYYPEGTAQAATTYSTKPLYVLISSVGTIPLDIYYLRVRKHVKTAPTITFAAVADITAEFTNPDVASEISACVGNVISQIHIYDVDFRNVMYEIGDFNATWRLPGTEGIQIWGIYQPRPVGDYYFPEMDNLGINDALFFTVTDYLVDIHDKIDIEGVRFDLQAIQVHPIADQKIYKMCVLKRQPEYYATCKGVVS
jgi:hypothetical protein